MDYIKGYLKLIALALVIIITLAGLSFGLRYMMKPANTALDQKTFMESQQYVDSSVRDLQEYQISYHNADAEGKKIIAATVQHQFANFPEDKVPNHLMPFYMTIVQGR